MNSDENDSIREDGEITGHVFRAGKAVPADADDTEGHSFRRIAEPEEGDDTQGHGRSYRGAGPDDDTEGHAIKARGFAPEEDDTEGHMSRGKG